MKSNPIDNATNMFGTIKPDIKKRIYKFLNNPNEKNWDDIHSIIVSGHRTIWQGVLLVDCTFPRSASLNEDNTSSWDRIPTPEMVYKAIETLVDDNS